jgi:predicted lipoprotein with Yx(FWY)xxD motif
MHRKDLPLRRLAFALAVPVIAVGAITLSASVASSSAPETRAAATEAPGDGQQSGGPAPGQSNFKLPTFKTILPSGLKSLTKSPSGSASKSPSKTPTKTPSKTPTKSPSKTPTKSGSAKPSASGGGVVPVPGTVGAGPNCANRTATPPTTVQVGTAGGKQALVDASGCALYLDNQDNATTSACDATCLQTWPALVGPGQAGSGVDQSKLATFTRDDGKVQVTYNGHQLYYFTGDNAPGDANGQAMQQIWYLVDPSGNAITS